MVKVFGLDFGLQHGIVLGAVLLTAVLYSGGVGGRLGNELGENPATMSAYRLFVNKYYSLSICDGESFKSYGILSNGERCQTITDCRDFWPAGPSFAIRDRSVCCFEGPAAGECGEVL